MDRTVKTGLIIAIPLGIIVVAALVGTGPIQDKRAVGEPGSKTFEVRVDGSWKIVPESGWERCGMHEQWPVCLLSDA